MVFDDTFEAIMTLWESTCGSTATWKPSNTILLISGAGFKSEQRPSITINTGSSVEIDPDMRDAVWLRDFAQKLTKREHVNQPFPEKCKSTVVKTNHRLRREYSMSKTLRLLRRGSCLL